MKEKGREAARCHSFHADACSDATARCKAVAVCSAITRHGRRCEWIRRSGEVVADSRPRDESRAQSAPPKAVWEAFWWASGDALKQCFHVFKLF
jgi:hypothetical protein